MKRHKILTGIGAVAGLFLVLVVVIGCTAPARPTAAATSSSAPTPAAAPPPPAPAVPPTPASVGTTPDGPAIRGLFNLVAWWDQNHAKADPAMCITEGEQPLPIATERAWQLPSGGIACYGDDHSPYPWAGHIVGIDVYFPKHVDEQTALNVTAALLPGDAVRAGVFDGVNTDSSTNNAGSCRQVVYTSNALAGVVSQTDPTWTGDPQKASLALYSGHASTDAGGADKPYRPESVNEVMVFIQGENRGADGVVHC